MSALTIFSLENFPIVKTGDGLADLIGERAALQDGDVVVVPAEMMSTAEGSTIALDNDDPASFEAVVARESVRTLRRTDTYVIAESVHGFVGENAGVTRATGDTTRAVLLPRDPDRSAFKLRERLRAATGLHIAVIVSHAAGRPWRNGNVGVALGCSGITPITDDHCVADAVASSALLSAGNSVSVVIVRGLDPGHKDSRAPGIRLGVAQKPSDHQFR
jgi:coenzyme F420-0:L-glutamate ligase/coenzyme F420-1:gamma-L-glutamate ligase